VTKDVTKVHVLLEKIPEKNNILKKRHLEGKNSERKKL